MIKFALLYCTRYQNKRLLVITYYNCPKSIIFLEIQEKLNTFLFLKINCLCDNYVKNKEFSEFLTVSLYTSIYHILSFIENDSYLLQIIKLIVSYLKLTS